MGNTINYTTDSIESITDFENKLKLGVKIEYNIIDKISEYELSLIAVKNGYLNIIKWLRSQNPPCPWSDETCYVAASYGKLEVLKWLRAQDPPCPWSSDVFTCVVKNCNIEVLQWLITQNPKCPYDNMIFELANNNGNLQVIELLEYLKLLE
jgi:hypothetical protein